MIHYHTNPSFLGRSRRDSQELSKCIYSVLQDVSNHLQGEPMNQNSPTIGRREGEFISYVLSNNIGQDFLHGNLTLQLQGCVI